MEQVAKTVKASNIVWDTIEFHDIAGLVAGASKGEGLGNKFLANIRECDALLHVVRAHTDENVIHPEGTVDPARTSRRSRPSCCSPTSTPPSAGIRASSATPAPATARRSPRRQWLRQVIEALQAGQPGAHRPGARRTRPTRPQPLPADRQARAVRRQRRRGRGRGAERRRRPRGRHRRGGGRDLLPHRGRPRRPRRRRGGGADARGARHRRVGPAPRRQRRLRPAAPDRVLHRRRGQARPDLAPARGPDGLARGGRDPLRHPEGLRARRGDRLGAAGRGGRLRRRARQGHAAARGPRLPDGGRRRDHG